MQFQENTPYDILTEKWDPVLNHEALPTIKDDYRKKVTAVLLENQEQALRQQHLVVLGKDRPPLVCHRPWLQS